MRKNSRSLMGLLGFTALFAAGLFVSAIPAQADPPGHAKAHGWRKKQSKKHKHSRSCRDEHYSRYNDRYDDDRYDDDRYADDNRWRQDQNRRRYEEDQQRRRYEEDQRRRRYEDDRNYNDRYGRSSGGSLEDLAGVFLGGGRGGDLGGLGGLLGGGRGGDLGGLLGGLRLRK